MRRFVGLLAGLLRGNSEALQAAAAAVLQEIASKRMEPAGKLAMLQVLWQRSCFKCCSATLLIRLARLAPYCFCLAAVSHALRCQIGCWRKAAPQLCSVYKLWLKQAAAAAALCSAAPVADSAVLDAAPGSGRHLCSLGGRAEAG